MHLSYCAALLILNFASAIITGNDIIYLKNESNFLKHTVIIPNHTLLNEDYVLEFADNENIKKLTEHYFSINYSLDVCFHLQDVLSLIVYGKIYTPMLPHSTTEDNIGTRTQLIEYFQRRYSYTSYLEVGCGDFANFVSLRNYFSQVDCIDPYKDNATYALPSDVFFEQRVHNNSIIRAATVTGGVVSEGPVTYDVIFIDGLHDAKQVIRDVMNALQLLNEHGI